MTLWQIYWDNGYGACGTYPGYYTDSDEADLAAADIHDENLILDIWDDEASVEVVEVRPSCASCHADWTPAIVIVANTPLCPECVGPLPHWIEGTVDHFDRFVAGDR